MVLKYWRWLMVGLALLVSGCVLDDGSLQVGMQAPSLRTKTLADVGGDFSRITSYRYPDERMYQYSLDDALATGKVVVLAFATPGHCTQCDKQLQMLKAVLDKYQKQVLFLHLDQYQNPEAFKSFNVIGDPWTYVVDGKHTIRFKRAGRMLFSEVDMVLAGLLREAKSS
jgi:thiol-disulfide isomerase/thioredoxin